MWLFGTAFTTDYELRGISQTNHDAAIQGYFELDYTAAPWLTLYAGLWGSNVSFADAEFDFSGGARFSYSIFGLDVGYVYYEYPSPTGGGNISYGEFYAKPSVKITDWLSIGGQVIGGDNFGNGGNEAWYYEGNATITPPQFLPAGIGIAAFRVRSVARPMPRPSASPTTPPGMSAWPSTTRPSPSICVTGIRTSTRPTRLASAPAATGEDLCDARFVATLKFDTSLSALK